MSRLHRVKRQTTLDGQSVSVLAVGTRSRDDTSILLATRTISDTNLPTSFSVSALTTVTTTSSPSSSSPAASSAASDKSKGGSTSVGLIAGLIVGLSVLVIVLALLLLKCSRKRNTQRRATMLSNHPPAISSVQAFADDASRYPASEKGTLRPNRRQKSLLSRRASVASWISGKSRMWRRGSMDRFEWYRSGLDDHLHLTKVPTPEMFERASPLQELTERATMGAWSKEFSEPSLSHYTLSRDLPDSESLREKY